MAPESKTDKRPSPFDSPRISDTAFGEILSPVFRILSLSEPDLLTIDQDGFSRAIEANIRQAIGINRLRYLYGLSLELSELMARLEKSRTLAYPFLVNGFRKPYPSTTAGMLALSGFEQLGTDQCPFYFRNRVPAPKPQAIYRITGSVSKGYRVRIESTLNPQAEDLSLHLDNRQGFWRFDDDKDNAWKFGLRVLPNVFDVTVPAEEGYGIRLSRVRNQESKLLADQSSLRMVNGAMTDDPVILWLNRTKRSEWINLIRYEADVHPIHLPLSCQRTIDDVFSVGLVAVQDEKNERAAILNGLAFMMRQEMFAWHNVASLNYYAKVLNDSDYLMCEAGTDTTRIHK